MKEIYNCECTDCGDTFQTNKMHEVRCPECNEAFWSTLLNEQDFDRQEYDEMLESNDWDNVVSAYEEVISNDS